jgi:hypothetical protein
MAVADPSDDDGVVAGVNKLFGIAFEPGHGANQHRAPAAVSLWGTSLSLWCTPVA